MRQFSHPQHTNEKSIYHRVQLSSTDHWQGDDAGIDGIGMWHSVACRTVLLFYTGQLVTYCF